MIKNKNKEKWQYSCNNLLRLVQLENKNVCTFLCQMNSAEIPYHMRKIEKIKVNITSHPLLHTIKEFFLWYMHLYNVLWWEECYALQINWLSKGKLFYLFSFERHGHSHSWCFFFSMSNKMTPKQNYVLQKKNKLILFLLFVSRHKSSIT